MTGLRALAALALLAGAGVAAPPGTELHGITTLLLVGDVGDPGPGSPVTKALFQEASRRPDETLVVFLGDNIYPDGLPLTGGPARQEAERRLLAQVEAVVGSGARGLFVPGNHDWQRGKPDGWEAVKLEERVVLEHGGGCVLYLPGGGCPGPAVLELPPRLRLVTLDTQWWLQLGRKPQGAGSPCLARSEAEVVAQLTEALHAPPGTSVVLLAHHPPASGGQHGGHLGTASHIFPLTELRPWLVIPLPLIGSIYPLSRIMGFGTEQDVTSKLYRHLIAALRPALEAAPPALFVTGHEHVSQVLSKPVPGVPLLVIAGGGSPLWLTKAYRIGSTRFVRNGLGFARIAVPPSGPLRLEMMSVERGTTRLVYQQAVPGT